MESDEANQVDAVRYVNAALDRGVQFDEAFEATATVWDTPLCDSFEGRDPLSCVVRYSLDQAETYRRRAEVYLIASRGFEGALTGRNVRLQRAAREEQVLGEAYFLASVFLGRIMRQIADATDEQKG